MGKLITLFAMSLVAIPHHVYAQISVDLPGCPVPLPVVLPQEFLPVSQSEEILKTLRANPNRRTQYAAAFTAPSLPMNIEGRPSSILIGTLGTTLQQQGRISHAGFAQLKNKMKEDWIALLDKAEPIRQKLEEGARTVSGLDIRGNKPVALEYMDLSPNGGAMLTFVTWEAAQTVQQAFSAARYEYHKGCIAFIQFSLPSTLSLSQVKEIVRGLSVPP